MKKQIILKVIAVVSISILLFLTAFTDDADAARLGACEKGLAICAVSTLAEFAAPEIMGLHLAYCFNGYAWCKAYAEPYF